MLNPLLLLAAVSAFSAPPEKDFSSVLANCSNDEIIMATTMGIDDWEDYKNYIEMNVQSLAENDGSQEWSDSTPIVDVARNLANRFPNYTWFQDKNNSGSTSDVSNHIPIEMKRYDSFPEADILDAIEVAGVQDKTNYGGCGPIAAIGVLDYFARYLGYGEIIDDPTNSARRIALAAEVMSNTNYSPTGNTDSSRVWPWDMVNGFNTVVLDHGLSIQAQYKVSLFGGRGSEFWNDIVENIDRGLPVSMLTAGASGDGSFANHYSNVYAYETWIGVAADNGGIMTKKFIKGRLNFGWQDGYYCDANILNYIHSGIVTYNPHYDESYDFTASDFAEEFVNDSGGGQYFFSPMSEPVAISDGKTLQTTRLRTSYIENEFLVLSPNRENAGTAYLDIAFPTKVSQLSFDAFLWSRYEGISGEEFKMQYYDDGWHDHITIDLSLLPGKYDQDCTRFALFPKDTTRIRFYVTHQSPSGSRNKGRICLDNFEVSYNDALWEA